MVVAKFNGWSSAAIEFYEGLESDNSKRYWLVHKDVYDHEVRAPMESLLCELEGEFGEARLFRPYRDTRFSKDKSPYKTAIAANVGTGYVALSAGGLMAGVGYYRMSSGQLERYRAAVAADRSGEQLEGIVGALRSDAVEVRSLDELKSAPRGYPKDHPRIEFLRFKGIVAMRSWRVARWLGTAGAKGRVEDVLRSGAPLVDWLTAHVGPAEDS